MRQWSVDWQASAGMRQWIGAGMRLWISAAAMRQWLGAAVRQWKIQLYIRLVV
jgi:hypothetical protein